MGVRILTTQNAFAIPVKEVVMPDFESVIEDAKEQILPLFDDLTPEDQRVKSGAAYYSGRTGVDSVYFDVKQELDSRVDITKITKWVEKEATIYWKELGLNPRLKPTVINSWCNLGKPGSMVWPHQHIPVAIACVFYLNSSKEMGNLVLQNPMEQMMAQLPYEMTYSSREFDFEFEATTGKLVMFPGWIKHYTRPNLTNDTRMSLALNVIGVGGINAMLGKDDARTVELRGKFTRVEETGSLV